MSFPSFNNEIERSTFVLFAPAGAKGRAFSAFSNAFL